MATEAAITKIFSPEEIAARVRELGNEVRKDAGHSEVFLLAILKGTTCLLADLMRAIPGRVRYGFMDEVQDMTDSGAAEAMEIDFLSHFDIGGRNVYLLKDIVSSGVIETYLLNQLRQRNPANLRLIALLDRPDLRTMAIDADYAAFRVKEGTFVGYGLEFEGQHGNLPYIGRIG